MYLRPLLLFLAQFYFDTQFIDKLYRLVLFLNKIWAISGSDLEISINTNLEIDYSLNNSDNNSRPGIKGVIEDV
jgi:hypothetical protein